LARATVFRLLFFFVVAGLRDGGKGRLRDLEIKRPPWYLTRAGEDATLYIAPGGHDGTTLARCLATQDDVPSTWGYASLVLENRAGLFLIVMIILQKTQKNQHGTPNKKGEHRCPPKDLSPRLGYATMLPGH
jgi:hypothetical protein